LTEQLLEVEHSDQCKLKDLAKRLKDFDKVTLWGLLIDLMLDDTRKHIKILEFIHDRSKDQPDYGAGAGDHVTTVERPS